MSERQGGGSMVASRVIAVPAGQIATIVTCLEMTAPPAPVMPVKSALKLERWTAPVDLDRYRALFRAIGQPWLWRGRLVMDDETLAATLNAPTLEVHVATRRDGTPQGLLELDFRQPDTCELAFFGVAPALIGGGIGRYLMNQAIDRAWARPINLFHVHTCTLDHPNALPNYLNRGFKVFKEEDFEDMIPAEPLQPWEGAAKPA